MASCLSFSYVNEYLLLLVVLGEERKHLVADQPAAAIPEESKAADGSSSDN